MPTVSRCVSPVFDRLAPDRAASSRQAQYIELIYLREIDLRTIVTPAAALVNAIAGLLQLSRCSFRHFRDLRLSPVKQGDDHLLKLYADRTPINILSILAVRLSQRRYSVELSISSTRLLRRMTSISADARRWILSRSTTPEALSG